MKTILIPPGEALDAVLAARAAIKEHEARREAIHAAANEQLEALQLEANRKMPALWEAVAKPLGMTVEELRRHYIDFSYLDEHRLAFLREVAQEQLPQGLAPSADSIQLEASRSLQ